MVFVFVWLTSHSMIISRSIHVGANGIVSFILWPSDIPLYIYKFHIFIHASVNGHWGGTILYLKSVSGLLLFSFCSSFFLWLHQFIFKVQECYITSRHQITKTSKWNTHILIICSLTEGFVPSAHLQGDQNSLFPIFGKS